MNPEALCEGTGVFSLKKKYFEQQRATFSEISIMTNDKEEITKYWKRKL